LLNDETILEFLRRAKQGDQKAETEIYELLSVRFLPVVTSIVVESRSLKKCPDLQSFCRETCDQAISRIRKVCPITSSNWSLTRLAVIMHNVADENVANRLVDLAKNGDSKAETDLFNLLNRKITLWFNTIRYGR
jgi:hypothetical protein